VPKKATPEQQRIRHHKYRYGLDAFDYHKMIEQQENKCYCCKKLGGVTKGSKLHIDHDHSTGTVRKLLCNRCNYIAGAIEDSRYEAVKLYLEQYTPSREQNYG
jgi:hypothetical protein